MVTYRTNRNIFELIDTAATGSKSADENWFATDITINLSNSTKGTTIVIDFSYDTSGLIEYTLDGGDNYTTFNSGQAIEGGQSRYIRVTNGVELNIRSKVSGSLLRAIVGEV